MACSQKVDLVSADYYEKELKFQGQIDRAERTHREASGTAIAYDAARQQITVSLPPGHGQGNVSGSIELYRPSAAEMDRAIKLEPDAHGIQRLDAAGLAPGLWKVRITWTAENQNYYLEQKVVVGAKPS
jgi:nitrogen fixation protein FixH